jgi:DNA-binding NtrC family response regulator
MEKSILFVDDEKSILSSIKREVFDTNYKTYFAENGKEALQMLYENDNINMVVSDLIMPEIDGYELLKKVKFLYPDLIRIVLSGYANKPLMLKNISKVYIKKPWEKEDFINTINDIFDSYDKLNKKTK